MKYQIKWKYKDGRDSGSGEFCHTLEQARASVDYYNSTVSDILHWYKQAEPENETETIDECSYITVHANNT